MTPADASCIIASVDKNDTLIQTRISSKDYQQILKLLDGESVATWLRQVVRRAVRDDARVEVKNLDDVRKMRK